MYSGILTPGTISWGCRLLCAAAALGLLLEFGSAQAALAQTGTNPLNLFQNFFVTGDYVVAGWVETSSNGVYATGTISVPDLKQQPFLPPGVPKSVPNGADIVAAYLYWGTVEGNQSTFKGQQATFNGYAITGKVLGNPNAPVSWSSGGCSGSAQGSKTMRTYRADVRPYLPLDVNPSSPTFGRILANGDFTVQLADSGSNGNTQPDALGATLVIIYRVLAPATPLNAIVLYDGAYAPSNTAQNVSQTITGFYQPAPNLSAKLTHIVANGQPNKSEQVYLNGHSQPLPSLYGALPSFPGIYGTWDNPTWVLSDYGYVKTTDTSETTQVVPSAKNSGCVSWGAMILSSTVQDSDGDGLLDVWETNQGYTDAVSGQFVALPGASPSAKDLFVEVDYLSNLDGSAGPYLHSHLPKQAALDAVGATLGKQGINVHFDLGPGVYQGDPYVISYPVATPSGVTTFPGAGGNAIPESAVLCKDGTTLCAFPFQPAFAWKGGFSYFQNQPTLGNFQPGRLQSYRYALFGHSLGDARSFWSTVGSELADPTIPQLVSIVNSGTTATVTIKSPQGVLKPGDCPNATLPACSDANNGRVTIGGALGQPTLNGTYFFSNADSSPDIDNMTTTTFTIQTANVADATYSFNNEPQLAVCYLGPTSTSGHSDFGGGGDLAVTLGLWGADDPSNCQPDPSNSLTAGQSYCNNQVGSTEVQIGTLLHELGHTLTLTHGGTYYNDPNNPSLPTYEPNCKPNFLSAMNYLFQVRGFADGGYDYSSQTLPPLNEAYPFLSESSGVGLDLSTGQTALHLTRWYSSPNALDTQLQKTAGGRYATVHCDGTPLGTNEPPSVRVDGTLAPGGSYSAPLDWNNDLVAGDTVISPGEDLDHNGIISGDLPFSGFDDWPTVNLQQMSARASAFGFSGGGVKFVSGGVKFVSGGVDNDGGGVKFVSGGIKFVSGGVEQDEDTATSTTNRPTLLKLALSGHNVVLNWTAPAFGQIRRYDIWRATGSFPTSVSVIANRTLFSTCPTCKVTGTPPLTTFTDTNVKNNTTYTYFVTDANKQGVQSGASAPATILVKF